MDKALKLAKALDKPCHNCCDCHLEMQSMYFFNLRLGELS